MNGWNLRKEIHPSKPSKPLNFFRFHISCSKCLYSSKPLDFYGATHSEVEHPRYCIYYLYLGEKKITCKKFTKKTQPSSPLNDPRDMHFYKGNGSTFYRGSFSGDHLQYLKSKFWTYCSLLFVGAGIPLHQTIHTWTFQRLPNGS